MHVQDFYSLYQPSPSALRILTTVNLRCKDLSEGYSRLRVDLKRQYFVVTRPLCDTVLWELSESAFAGREWKCVCPRSQGLLKFTIGRRMSQRTLATREWTVGFTVLLLLMTPAAVAQLPEAPSPSWSVQWAADPLPTALLQRQLPAESPESVPLSGGLPPKVAHRWPVPGGGPLLDLACPPASCSLAQEDMCCGEATQPFARYLKRPGVTPLTSRDKLHMAISNVISPFNLGTIALDAAVGVASNSHSPYGPGFNGFAKYAGVSMTENMTGEFFGTFLVPSLAHQDPRYHRVPFLPVGRRILHAVEQVVWAQSDTGRPMFNYGNFVGGIATAVVSNTFVPGPGRQGVSDTSKRLAVAFAFSPTGNLITEFFPELARRLNLRVVIFQRILNTVSIQVSGAPPAM